ncbi:MAG: hypothetical protein KC474_01840 [Cyanobacteria bacterium HKST-UBA04]|nr:hypothetical protein [Cyanobacteria bacterium HKST-UBA04]
MSVMFNALPPIARQWHARGPIHPNQQAFVPAPPLLGKPGLPGLLSLPADRLLIRFGATETTTAPTETDSAADPLGNGQASGQRNGPGNGPRNGSSNGQIRQTHAPARTTKKGDISAITPTMGRVVLLWFRQAHATPVGLPTRTDTNAEDIQQRLVEFLDTQRNSFVLLADPDVDGYAEQRFSAANVRGGIKWLEDQGFITKTNANRDSESQYTYQLTLTRAGVAEPLDTLENILLDNVPLTRKVALVVSHNLAADTPDDGFGVGDEVPKTLYVDNQPVPPYVRQLALRDVCLDTGRIQKVVEGTRCFYRVVDPNEPGPPPTVSLARRTMPILLHFLATTPTMRRPDTVLPGQRELTALTGKASGFREALAELADDGLLKALPGQYNPYAVARAASDQELAAVMKSKQFDQDRYTESLLRSFSNADRDQSQPWVGAGTLTQRIAFPPTMLEKNHGPKTSMVIDTLEGTPVPLLMADHDRTPLRAWLNRNVDYDQLATTLNEINQNPMVLAHANRLELAPWQLPRLYEAQVHAKPTLWLQPQGDHYTLEMGLTDTTNRHAFTPLSALPNTRVSCPEPSAALIEPEADPTFNLKRYGRYYLHVLQELYPLPQLKDLKTEPAVTVTAEQANTLRLALADSLRHIGFQLSV